MMDESSAPRRKVNYNQEAVLCSTCKKRIRLNNNGRLRIHAVGKKGSEQCESSDNFPALPEHIAKSVEEFLKNPSIGVVRERPKRKTLFSDVEH